MKVMEFEDKVWEIEGIRIVIRTPSNAEIGDFTNSRAAVETWTVREWMEKRIQKAVGGHEVVVVGGDGEERNWNAKLKNIRSSYQ